MLSRRGNKALLYVQVKALHGLARLWAEVKVGARDTPPPARFIDAHMTRGNLKTVRSRAGRSRRSVRRRRWSRSSCAPMRTCRSRSAAAWSAIRTRRKRAAASARCASTSPRSARARSDSVLVARALRAAPLRIQSTRPPPPVILRAVAGLCSTHKLARPLHLTRAEQQRHAGAERDRSRTRAAARAARELVPSEARQVAPSSARMPT